MSGLAIFDNQSAHSAVDDDEPETEQIQNEEKPKQEDVAQAFNVECIHKDLPVLLINDLPLYPSESSDQSRHNKVSKIVSTCYPRFIIADILFQ